MKRAAQNVLSKKDFLSEKYKTISKNNFHMHTGIENDMSKIRLINFNKSEIINPNVRYVHKILLASHGIIW